MLSHSAFALKHVARRTLHNHCQFAKSLPSSVATSRRFSSATTTTTTNSAANAKAAIAKAEPEFIRLRRKTSSAEFQTETWLSDPSTYPIVVVLGGALLVCAGRCIHGFFYCDDVKVDPTRRGSVVRSYEEQDLGIKSRLESVGVEPDTGRSFLARAFEPADNEVDIYPGLSNTN